MNARRTLQAGTLTGKEIDMKKILAILLCVSLGPVISCERPLDEGKVEEPVLVEVAPVKRGMAVKEINFTGGIEAESEINVYPKITARIEELRVDTGDQVQKNDIIAVLESDELRAQVEQARAALDVMKAKWARMKIGARQEEISQAEDMVKKARAGLIDTERNYQRMQTLFEKDLIARRKFEEAEVAYTVAKADLNSAMEQLKILQEGATREDRQALFAQLKQAEATLDLAKIRLSYARIISHMDGIISRRYFDPGDLASPGKPLFEIVQMDEVKIIVHFPENHFTYMDPGTPVQLTVDACPDRTFSGKINKVEPTLDSATRMFSAEVKVKNGEHILRPGMFAKIRIVAEPHPDALLVPKSSVFSRGEFLEAPSAGSDISRNFHIFVVKDNRADLRKVALGHDSGDLVEILGDVKEGALVVVRGVHKISDGGAVEIANMGGGTG